MYFLLRPPFRVPRQKGQCPGIQLLLRPSRNQQHEIQPSSRVARRTQIFGARSPRGWVTGERGFRLARRNRRSRGLADGGHGRARFSVAGAAEGRHAWCMLGQPGYEVVKRCSSLTDDISMRKRLCNKQEMLDSRIAQCNPICDTRACMVLE